MPSPYKLKDEIKSFIIGKKKSDPAVSCRQLVPIIWERFQLKLSKSSINAIIKEYKLSSGVGRRRIRPRKSSLTANIASVLSKRPDAASEPISVVPEVSLAIPEVPVTIPQKPSTGRETPGPVFEYVKPQEPMVREPLELCSVGQEVEYLSNCGLFLMRTADYKASFTNDITSKLLPLLPDLKREVIFFMLEISIYSSIFNNDNELYVFIGKRPDFTSFVRLQERLAGLDLSPVRGELVKAGLRHDKIGDFKGLCEERIYRLNSLVQELFFPTVYQFLDFPTMFSRFYCFPGRIERKNSFLGMRLFYPPNSQWANDVVWQEDFVNTVNKINQERIITPEGERIWFDPVIGFHK